jgi:hypothetical protein
MNHLLLVNDPCTNTTWLYSDHDSDDLWRYVNDDTIHLFLREPMLLELARRNDSRVLDFCESLLQGPDIEYWFSSLKALALLGSNQAADRLMDLYMESSPEHQRYVALYLAQTIGPKQRDSFKKIARDFAAVGILNVSSWTTDAVMALRDVCKRFGISVLSAFQNEKRTESAAPSLVSQLPLL